MKPKKQKRIRAVKLWSWFAVGGTGPKWIGRLNRQGKGQRPFFVIAASDVPAFIEQLAKDYFHGPIVNVDAMTYALKRAGITPPKGGAR